MSLNGLLEKSPATLPILQATFGLERESLRIGKDHRIAQTDHPACLGSRSFHPYIQTDYSEAQLELITPIAHSTKEADRKSTRLNSSHVSISYAVFCLKKKNE